MAAHTYWRMLVTANAGSVCTIMELQMYDAAGTYLNTGGTASASSYYVPEGLVPANAFDGNFSTKWASNGVPSSGSPEWIRYQFASPVDVATVRIARRDDAFGMEQRPYTFKFQWSDDGSAWTDATASITPAWTVMTLVLSFKIAATAGYVNWRALILTTQDGLAPDCAELQLRGTPGGASLVTTTEYRYGFGTDRFSTGQDYYMAFDGNASSYWRGGSGPHFVAVAWHKILTVVEVLYQASNSSYTRSAATFKIQGSNDGAVTWTDVSPVLTAATWTSLGQTQVFTFAAAAGMLRIHPGMEGGLRPLLVGGTNG